MAAQPQGQVLEPGIDEEEEITSGGTLSAIEEADRSHQVATAKRFPRSITKFRNELIEIAKANQPVAMEMMYSLPRAGKQLVGPSVRFAEAVISCWGNSRAGVEVVDVDRINGIVTAEGRFYDCEKNVGLAIRVRRRVVAKRIDADAIQVTGAAASSIALRGAILRGVPKALWNDVFEMAKSTAAGDAMSMDRIRAEMLKLFTALGVTEARVLDALGIAGVPDIGADEVVAMKAWHKQLTSKESTIEDIFGYPEDEEIDWLMNALGWNETVKRTSKANFAKDKTGHLAYVRGEAQKAGITYSSAKAAQTQTSQASTPKQAETKPSEEDTTTAQKTGTTAEASTSATAQAGEAKKATAKKVDPGW